MIRVLVQVMGPVEGSGANYNWITIGSIDNPSSVDIEALQPHIKSIIEKSMYKSPTPAVRLTFEEEGQAYMKMIISE